MYQVTGEKHNFVYQPPSTLTDRKKLTFFLNNNSILCLFSSNKFNCFFLFLDPLKTHNRRLPIEAIERHYKSLLPPIQSD